MPEGEVLVLVSGKPVTVFTGRIWFLLLLFDLLTDLLTYLLTDLLTD